MFVAIDRPSKFAYAELHEKAGKMVATQFLHNLVAAVPYAIHTVLTDNGIQFTNRRKDRHAFEHIFDRVCCENGIEHRLKTLRGLTPYEYIGKIWTKEPERFSLDPILHQCRN